MSCVRTNLVELGWDGLSDRELLSLVISPGMSESAARSLAGRLLEALGSLRRLQEAGFHQLCQAGLGKKRALALAAAIQMTRRGRRVELRPNHSFHSSAEVFSYFRPLAIDLGKECFWVLLLDGKNRVLRIERVSEGSLTRAIVHPREVFRPAIREGAASVLFVHNHPSGEPRPSKEDRQITQRLVETGKVIGIQVLDHVIIGRYRYFSFADEGEL
ncbi:MAG: DNA repair protein RadC [Acidobacteriota bacterium]|nr:MAG: DNA repair protein RadC [Acidobacteriota bacterium]